MINNRNLKKVETKLYSLQGTMKILRHHILAPPSTFLTNDVIEAANADLKDGFDANAFVAAEIVSAECCCEGELELFLKLSCDGVCLPRYENGIGFL